MYITNEAALKRRGPLTWTLVEELMQLGPAAFCKKYGYSHQGKSVVFRIHNKLSAANAQHVESFTDRTPPEVIREAISLLPPRGMLLNDERRELVKSLLDHAVDMAYDPQRR
jgi:hypothetical protein